MNDTKTRNVLAMVVVCGYVLSMVTLGLAPPLMNIGEPTVINEQMKTFGSLLTGIVGMIIGFYFGRGSASGRTNGTAATGMASVG